MTEGQTPERRRREGPTAVARVVATAGHVDHGKSTLVQALTGQDPDRWAEEKARGLTIDLGFAATVLASGTSIAFVDVPGHERFVRNMLAGVGAAEACLLVVAATEGWRAQTEEHLRILEVVGLRAGVVALTHVARVDAGRRAEALAELDARLAGTFLRAAPRVGVDAPAGVGVGELRDALDGVLRGLPPPAGGGRPRMWIDRAFAIRGSGTVVTGTLTGGEVAVGDQMAVVPGERTVRLRALQAHGEPRTRAAAGSRVAANLTGASSAELGRGQALVRRGEWHPARAFDATLTVLSSLDHALSARGAFTLHVGTGAFPVRLRVFGDGTIEPGAAGLVRVWLQGGQALPLAPGDRYVLRDEGRAETQGGGEILQLDPGVPVKRARPSRSVEHLVAEAGWIDVEELFRRTGEHRDPTVDRWLVDPAALEASRRRLAGAAREAGAEGIALARLGARDRALARAGVPGAVIRADRLVPADAATGLSPSAEALLSSLTDAGWSPPALPPESTRHLRELERAGLAVDAGGAWFATSAVEGAAARIAQLLRAHPAGFTVAQARDALGSTRKHVVPLMSHLDAIGVTRRRGDLRIAGPRLGQYQASPR